ncbi:phosphodiester glycosidase family protein [bacterium]|nr:MAG: phosphodiester glycosidase family protein [bacterium]
MLRQLTLLPVLLLSACAPAQLVWEKPIAPGLVYREEVDRAMPRVIHAVRITPGSPALRLSAEPTGGAINEAASAPTGRTSVGTLAAKTGALAAVNADFFVDQAAGWNGHPLGLMVRAGELLATPLPVRSVFAWGPEAAAFGKASWTGTVRADGRSEIKLTGINRAAGANDAVLNTAAAGQAIAGEGAVAVTLRMDGTLAPTCTVAGTVELVSDEKPIWNVDAGKAVLVLRGIKAEAMRGLKPGDRIAFNVRTQGFDWEKFDSAVGGGPMLVVDGETAIDGVEQGFGQSSFVLARHPRTAVGRTADGDLWLVAVDGRSPLSIGASLPEMATIMKRLGCVEAMNLDGGGSTALSAMGLTLNRPSTGRERAVANALLVRGSAPTPLFGPLRLVVPASVRDGQTVDAKIIDAKGRTVPNARVLWVATGSLWMDQGGRLRVLSNGQGIVQAAVDGQVLTAKVTAKK